MALGEAKIELSRRGFLAGVALAALELGTDALHLGPQAAVAQQKTAVVSAPKETLGQSAERFAYYMGTQIQFERSQATSEDIARDGKVTDALIDSVLKLVDAVKKTNTIPQDFKFDHRTATDFRVLAMTYIGASETPIGKKMPYMTQDPVLLVDLALAGAKAADAAARRKALAQHASRRPAGPVGRNDPVPTTRQPG